MQEVKKGMATTEKFQKSQVYWHRLGTDIEQDKTPLKYGVEPLVNVPPIAWPYILAVPNSSYTIAGIYSGVNQRIDLYVSQFTSLSHTSEWKKICDASDEVTHFTVQGEDIYLLTSKNAPHFKIVKTSLEKPNLSEAETMLGQSDKIIRNMFAAHDALYAIVMHSGISEMVRISYDGKIEQLDLPFDGSVEFLENDPSADGILLSIMSWTKYDRDYEYDPKIDQFTEIELQPKGKYDAPDDLVSTEVTVKSHDGIMVPLSIIHKRGVQLDGSNPCLLVGYGGYAYSFDPYYRRTQYAWYEQGGIWAIAHVRGGGENGEEWHRAGFQQTKPNTWKDFIACAEYLIKQQYTSPEKLAGEGTSAGGILIGRAITERPDLFSVAIPRVGVLNTVRFVTTPNGVCNVPELGSCDTEKGFHSLYEMDAFLHIRNGINYPAMIITHGITDPRVEPWQSAKFTAQVQATSTSNRPVLLRMDYEAGHGVGSTKTQLVRERADIFAFVMWQFGIEKYQPL
jgi:prolyl oligopeptidase